MPEPVSAPDQLAAQLLATGTATVHVSETPMTLAAWQSLARAAARQLGRPIKTTANEDRAWAVLRDWPSGPDEQARHDALASAATKAVAARHTLVAAIAAMESK